MSPRTQTLKGFRDFLPADMRIRRHVFDAFREVFEQFGYEPLETPVLEHADLLAGKYGEEGEQLMYRFKDHGGRDVAMKYDLTVPACRVYAQYRHQLPRPFKRYQIQPVWRAENTQKGRFREFYQCDADIFGLASPLADAEFIQMIDILVTRLHLGTFRIRINNRKITNALVHMIGATDKQFIPIVTAIDKLEKIGIAGVEQELEKRSIETTISKKLLSFISETIHLSTREALKKTSHLIGHIQEGREGIAELEAICAYLKRMGVNDDHYAYDVSIVRGLSYYTGPVWETTIIDGNIGSISGSGRYDNLVGSLLGTGESIPATGGSFGIERIIQVLKDKGQYESSSIPVHMLMTLFDQTEDTLHHAYALVSDIRASGISAELWLDPTSKLDKQIKYAHEKKIPYVVITGPDEIQHHQVTVKDMKQKTQKTMSRTEFSAYLSSLS